MSKLSIIHKRDLEPLMLKAVRIAKHYEKATNYSAVAMNPGADNYDYICKRCSERKCKDVHLEAVKKARQLGGSFIYLCPKNNIFWTSPFYSGERLAGSLLSGGIKKSEKSPDKVKALAQLILLCADQISSMSFIQKNVVTKYNSLYQEPVFSNLSQTIQETEKTNSMHDMERMLIASLRRGDNTEAQKILVTLLKSSYLEIKNNFSAAHRTAAFRHKALELAVLLSRAATDSKETLDNSTLETTNRCLIKIEESKNFDDIVETLSAITERMSGMIFSYHGVRHFAALRKAERYIWANYTKKLSLREIAKASGLSAPYFSTVFKDEMGENLSNYLNKLRVKKAAAMLVSSNTPISEVAVACGFEDQSWFSKIFKKNTGFTPGKYRELGIHSDEGLNTKGNTSE